MDQVRLRDYYEEARSLIQSGQADRAIQIVRHILHHYPRHVESYLLLGEALLVAGHYNEATTQFRRVLSADPEHATARVGLAKIYEARGELDKALWQMQRATELLPGDSDLHAQLARLLSTYPQGDLPPEEPEMTRAALGRIYARRGLYAKAIEEFRSILAQDPNRTDVQATLAEVLWRAGDHMEAAEVSQKILEKLPHALKANLIVGALYANSDRPDAAEPYFSLAQSLDPENQLAQSLFDDKSPLQPRVAAIDPLQEDQIKLVESQPPSTMPAGSAPVAEEHKPVVDRTSKLYEEEAALMTDQERPDEEFELPDWLRGVGDDLLETEEQPPAASSSGQDAEAGEETPGWLRKLLARSEEAAISAGPSPQEPGDMPGWLQELRTEEAPPASIPQEPEEEPVSPETAGAGTAPQPAAEEPAVEEPEMPPMPAEEAEGMELPDWLKEFQEPEAQEEEHAFLEPISDQAAEGSLPDWLQEIMAGKSVPGKEEEPIGRPAETSPEAPVVEEELPDWLRDIQAPEAEESAALPEVEALQPGPQPAASADEGRALWEQILAEEGIDLESAEEAPPPEAAGMSAEEWLRSTADLDQRLRPTTAPQPPAEEPEIPPMPAEEPEEPALAPTAAAGMDMEGLPDWLREAAESAPVDAQAVEPELPDWLREFQEPAAEEEPSPEAAPDLSAHIVEHVEETVQIEADQAGLPEWLSELQEGTPEQEPSLEAEAVPDLSAEAQPEMDETIEVEIDETGLPDWLRTPAAEEPERAEPEAAPAAEMPEWLAELETGDMLLQEADFGELAELETGEMPEWLGEIVAGEPPLAGERAAQGEVTPSQEAEEQLPDWLLQFRRREAEEAVAESPAEVLEPQVFPETEQVEAEELPEAELPDWLAQLREGVSEAEIPGEVAAEFEARLEEELPPEAEALEIEEAGPAWLGDLVRAEEEVVEFEFLEEEEEIPFVEAPAPELEEAVEMAEAEAPAEELEPVEETQPVAEFELEEEEQPLPEVEWEEELPQIEVAELELEEEEQPLPEVEWEEELPQIEVPEPVAVPSAKPTVTRELEELSVEELPEEASARLSMARAALNAGDWPEALIIYETLVSASELLDSVIDHLQVGLQRFPDESAGYELLGDACMKDGRLYEALQAYRTALGKL